MIRARRKTQTLAVYQNARRVGTLDRASSGAISFTYAPSWIEDRNAFAISLNLPIQEQAFKGAEVSAFFDNLLPDNIEIRNKVAQRVNAQSARTFDLLHAIGHDCVGALQFIESGAEPPTLGKLKAQPLPESKISEILKNLSFFPLGMESDEPEFRISIAGAQEKTALLQQKGKWYLPHGTTPTTHILKPPMGILHNGIDLSTSVENEWLCLKICELLGLKVPPCTIVTFGDRKCLVVERFDRKWLGPGKLIRLPQEDLCQALGYPPTKKYESDGGPGIPRIMEFLDASDERNQDRADFMRAQVIFYCLAATDGHAKNFSIFHSPTGFCLTPIYDVMSIFPAVAKKQIAWQKGKLAMAVGDSRHYRLKQIARRHFEETAKDAGYSVKATNQMMDELKEQIHAGLADKLKLPKNFPEEIFATILQGMKKQAQRL